MVNHISFHSLAIANTAGPLCEYTETSISETLRQSCRPFEEYFNSLDFTCQAGEPAKLVWTPDENTPDLVYYQVIASSDCIAVECEKAKSYICDCVT